MIHSTKLHTVSNTETPGDAFAKEFRDEITTLLSNILDQAGVGTAIMWGDWAMLYYGVPIGVNLGFSTDTNLSFLTWRNLRQDLHLLVPDDQLQKAHAALILAGYKEEPLVIEESHGLLDPNIRWEELGCEPHRFGEPLKVHHALTS